MYVSICLLFLIMVLQIRSVDDSNDVYESFDVDEVQIFICSVCLLILNTQGLLDDGDLAMEDGEIESKVSVSVILSVYCLCRLPLRIVW